MDLFPKDYKKNDSVPGAANSPARPMAFLTGLKEKLSASRGSRFSSVKVREAVFRLATIVSGAALVLILLLWAGLHFYQKSLTSQISDLKKQQAEVFNAKDKEVAAQIVDFDKGMALAQAVLKKHVYATAVFEKLAAATLPRVQWQSFGLAVKDSSLNLKGLAADYSTLAKQILALQDGGFSGVKINNIALDKAGGVSFSAAFNFNPEILKR